MTNNESKGEILIVDDSINNIELLSEIFSDYYEVMFANTGSKGLQLATEKLPDLILLDIVMPETDGYEIIKILKNDTATAHIPVIFITAKSSKEDMLEGFRLGAVDYITKPFYEEEVLVRVKTHIEHQILIKALAKQIKF